MARKYKLERKKFIEWVCISCFADQFEDKIKEDLIKGSEFIITAEDLLARCKIIPTKLLAGTFSENYISVEYVELYYEQPKTD